MVLVLGVTFQSQDNANQRQRPYLNNGLRTQATASGLAAGCGDIFDFSPQPGYYGTIPSSYTQDHIPSPATIIPVYGFMSNEPFREQENYDLYDRTAENPYDYATIQRALWEGYYIIWLSPDLPDETLETVQTYVNQRNSDPNRQNKTLVLLWTDSTPLPMGTQVAYSAWGQSQSCLRFSGLSFETFDEHYHQRSLAVRDFNNPPEAKLDEQGNLPSY